MARRSDHTPDELKALAIAKAIEMIDKNGPDGFTARGVAKAMGYTVGTLYHMFGDMDQFMVHVNAAILDDWHAKLQRGLAKNGDAPLRYLARGYIDFAKRHSGRWAALFSPRADGRLPPWYAKKTARLFGLVESALKHEARHIKDPARTAQVLWAGIHGICVLSLSGKLDTVGAHRPEMLMEALLEPYIGKI